MNQTRLSELIEQLQELQKLYEPLDMDPIVMSSSDYGDHVHTEQLNHICEVATIVPGKSAYSDSGLCYRSSGEDDEDAIIDDNVVIVLRGVL